MVNAGMLHAQVGKAVGLGRATITRIVKQSKGCGTVETAKKSGRPRLNTNCNLPQLQTTFQLRLSKIFLDQCRPAWKLLSRPMAGQLIFFFKKKPF
jgi:transposase